MVEIIDGVKQYKYYRKDFTDEERAVYNKYVSNRMCVYFKTEKGKLKASENNRKQYYKKKEEAELFKAYFERPKNIENEDIENI
jgi:hypothetical protein